MAKRTRIWQASTLAALLAVAAVIVGACGGGSPQARSITLTFIRNAQSVANADGIIDTALPGPSLTDDGKGQARGTFTVSLTRAEGAPGKVRPVWLLVTTRPAFAEALFVSSSSFRVE